MPKLFKRLAFSRRNLLLSFLTLSVFMRLRSGKPQANPEGNETVIAGRWVLKKSDIA